MSRVMRFHDFCSYEALMKGMRASKDESTVFQKEEFRLSIPETRVKLIDNVKRFCLFQFSPTNNWQVNIAYIPDTHNTSSNLISFKAVLRIRLLAPSSISASTS